jgi:septal ring factor EnvC (AmiA/AmiB activator)
VTPDLERLEKAVLELASRHAAVRGDNARLLRALAESQRRVAQLEAELRQGNQLQNDVAKRIDDLVGQIDQIEERFAARGA